MEKVPPTTAAAEVITAIAATAAAITQVVATLAMVNMAITAPMKATGIMGAGIASPNAAMIREGHEWLFHGG